MIRTNFLHLGLSTGSTGSHGHRKFSREPPGRRTIVGRDREQWVVAPGGCGRDCAAAALARALLGGPSISPLDSTPKSVVPRSPRRSPG